MAALEQGVKAPAIYLPLVGGMQFSLEQALQRGPVLAVFFKISCPVCQLAMPFLERIYQAVKATDVSIIGVSQNSAKDTQFFMRQYGVTFPIALDDPKDYAASNAYGLTNVPSIFYIGQDGTIEISCVGWSKNDVEEIARRISERQKLAPIPLIRPGENVPAFQAG